MAGEPRSSKKYIMKSKNLKTTLGIAACLAVAGIAYAAVIVDDQGVGFVGKGDVQLKFDWNNAQLQANVGNVKFQISSTEVSVTESTWTCDRDGGPQTQERARTTTTTTTTQGLLSSVARFKNQVTGFNLNGFNGAPTVTPSTTTEGPALNSCPTGWTAIDSVTSDPVTTSTGGLQVSGDNGSTWVDLPNTPTL